MKKDKTNFSDSQKRMHECVLFLWNHLKNIDAVVRNNLVMYLVQRCYLVVVSASDRNSAYRIFSVMNDRGMDLSPTDLLKADIIGGMSEQIRARYTDQWEEIEEKLGRDEFRDLFAHIRMIYVKSKARGNLNQEFRDGGLNKMDEREFVDSVLVPMSKAYEIVSKSAYASVANAYEINKYLTHLGRLDNYDWMPAAIMFFNLHSNDHDLLLSFIRDLERLAYGLFLQRSNINDRIKRYAGVLRIIESGGDLFAPTSALQLTNEDKSSILETLNGPVYRKTRVRLPLLLRLDGLLSDGGAIYDHKVLSIEHVLPQSPAVGSEWLDWFPDIEKRENWTHRLANLVLLSRWKNSQAQNYDFKRKKDEYFLERGVATFALTSQVLNERKWDVSVLEKRQKALLERLSTEWRLESEKG